MSGTVDVSHTIMANQLAGGDCSGTVIDNGFNLDTDGNCSTFTTIPTFTMPPLANNGGPTQTHALISGGAGQEAIDAGDITCNVATDQRSEPRPVGQKCDIRAFEVQ